MCRGLPASGKSSWAKEQIKNNPAEIKRVNKDDLRAMLHDNKWSEGLELSIVMARDVLIHSFLSAGFDVISDDTNLDPEHEERLRELATDQEAEFHIQDFTHVSPSECLKRNRARGGNVPDSAIFRMWEQHLKPTPKYSESKTNAVICDLDGTVAHIGKRRPYGDDIDVSTDDLNDIVYAMLVSAVQAGLMVLFVSGRSEKHRTATEYWLMGHGIRYHMLLMRGKDDQRADEILKREMYEKYIEPDYNVRLVIDDRPKVLRMWRFDLGLPTVDVGYGIEF